MNKLEELANLSCLFRAMHYYCSIGERNWVYEQE